MIQNLKNLILLLAVAVCATIAVAQENKDAKFSQERPSTKVIPVSLNSVQEDAAMEFAKEHHPELAKLLEQLRKSSPSGFSQGVREIHGSIQRLDRYKEKQPARFQQELENWKTDSNIRLLTAKWVMSQDPELERQIRLLLRTRQQAKIDRLQAERERTAERLKQLDNQIGMGTAELEADLAAEWDRLSKRAAVSAKSRKRPSKDTNDNSASKAKPKPVKTK